MEQQLRVLIIVENLAGSIRPPCLVRGDDAPRRRALGVRDLPERHLGISGRMRSSMAYRFTAIRCR